jgi:hypothetical protein
LGDLPGQLGGFPVTEETIERMLGVAREGGFWRAADEEYDFFNILFWLRQKFLPDLEVMDTDGIWEGQFSLTNWWNT